MTRIIILTLTNPLQSIWFYSTISKAKIKNLKKKKRKINETKQNKSLFFLPLNICYVDTLKKKVHWYISMDRYAIDLQQRKAWKDLIREESGRRNESRWNLRVSMLWEHSCDTQTAHCPRQLISVVITLLCPRMWILNYNADDLMKGQLTCFSFY